jgi:hypothetical protein
MAEEIDLYYEAIVGLKDKLDQWGAERGRQRTWTRRIASWISNATLIAFVLNVVPVIPVAVTALLPRTTIGLLTFGGSDLGAFVTTWIILAGLSAAVGFMADGLESRLSGAKTEPPGELSAEQMTFLCAYGAAKELDLFLASGVEDHHRTALHNTRELILGPVWFFSDHSRTEVWMDLGGADNLREGHSLVRHPDSFMVQPSLPGRIQMLRSVAEVAKTEGWLELTPRAERRVRGLGALPRRLLPRVELKEDLGQCRDVLRYIAEFSFEFLPDRLVKTGSAPLGPGAASLDSATAILDAWPDLEPRPRMSTPRKSSRGHQVALWLAGSHPGARFLRWVVVLFPVTVLLTGAISFVINISQETAAYIIVPTTILGAAALAAARPSD